MKTEGLHVIALYKHDGAFYLIHVKTEAYETWAAKKQREPRSPPFIEVD